MNEEEKMGEFAETKNLEIETIDLKAIEIDEETEIALQTIMEFPEKGSIKLRGEVQESVSAL
uniref:Uncharacterized protein n=1 Tax=Cucumis melo TaxID=3656 RepID=A0A9I9EKI0_CUCME